MTTTDDAVRALIAQVRAERRVPRDDLALDLARAAETLMAERDQARRDWYAANRRIAHLEAEVERLRGVVAEEIAQAIEVQAVKIRDGLFVESMVMGVSALVRDGARIAREHGTKEQP